MGGREVHNLTPDNSLKELRIGEHPIRTEQNLVVNDMLEETGTLRLYEYLGGTLYLGSDLRENNTAPVAEMEIIKSCKGELLVKRLTHGYGHEELVHIMVNQALYFAEFYGTRVGFLDLQKI